MFQLYEEQLEENFKVHERLRGTEGELRMARDALETNNKKVCVFVFIINVVVNTIALITDTITVTSVTTTNCIVIYCQYYYYSTSITTVLVPLDI